MLIYHMAQLNKKQECIPSNQDFMAKSLSYTHISVLAEITTLK